MDASNGNKIGGTRKMTFDMLKALIRGKKEDEVDPEKRGCKEGGDRGLTHQTEKKEKPGDMAGGEEGAQG